MQLSGAALITQFRTVAQRSLLPVLEQNLGPLSERYHFDAAPTG